MEGACEHLVQGLIALCLHYASGFFYSDKFFTKLLQNFHHMDSSFLFNDTSTGSHQGNFFSLKEITLKINPGGKINHYI